MADYDLENISSRMIKRMQKMEKFSVFPQKELDCVFTVDWLSLKWLSIILRKATI